MRKVVDRLLAKAQNCRINSKYYGEKAIWMAKAYEDAAEDADEILGSFDFNEIKSRLSHYEELKAQKRLIELPCAKGDIVWKIELQRDNYDNRVYPIAAQAYFDVKYLPLIGKTVFLTEDEAKEKVESMTP